MNDSRESLPAELTRQELLSAVDFEISHREGAASRYGLTVWTIVAAVVGLLWAAVNETMDNVHLWRNVVLVLVIGQWGLALLTLGWTKPLNTMLSVGFSSEGGLGPKQLLLSEGVHPDLVPYYILGTLLQLCLAVYLGSMGFILLCVVTTVWPVIALILLLITYVVLHVRVPIRLKPDADTERKTKRSTGISIAMYFLLGLSFLAAIWSVAPVWPTLAKSDIRLGCFLAALMTLFDISLRLTRAPAGVSQLRSVRSRLAFGLVSVAAARAEAESILLGSPQQSYVTGKAEAAITELTDYVRHCDVMVALCERVKVLADRVKAASGDKKVLGEIASEFRPLFRKMQTECRALDRLGAAAANLRIQFSKRVEAAKLLLDIKPEVIQASMHEVQAHVDAAEAVRRKMTDALNSSRASFDLLCESQRGEIRGPQRLKRSDLFAVLFRD
jgi:hypothetical protein